MKTARVFSVCECQARLGAEVDEERHVLRGWALDPKRGRELVAPANAMAAKGSHFDVGWACPNCTRNVLRSFDATALLFQEAADNAG